MYVCAVNLYTGIVGACPATAKPWLLSGQASQQTVVKQRVTWPAQHTMCGTYYALVALVFFIVFLVTGPRSI